jgi:hypothetical protein
MAEVKRVDYKIARTLAPPVDWRELMRQRRFEEAEPWMLGDTELPDHYGTERYAKAGFYEAWGDHLRPSSAAAAKYEESLRHWRFIASCATSGGEGLQRMLDVERVEKKIARNNDPGNPIVELFRKVFDR